MIRESALRLGLALVSLAALAASLGGGFFDGI
jgi:hypothetical protein